MASPESIIGDEVEEELGYKPKDYQIPHINNILNCFGEGYIGIGDTSHQGSGKTFVWGYIARKLGYKVLVVCPNSVKEQWKEECKLLGTEWIDIINYEGLIGREQTGCKHKWLNRKGDVYTPTKKYLKAINDGIILIFDEVHRVKCKDAFQSKASFVLASSIVGTISRIGVLSNTIFDKEKYAGSIMKALGIIRAEKMYTYDMVTRNYVVSGNGLAQLIGYCNKLDSERTAYLRAIYPLRDKNNLEELPYQLYIQIIRKKLIFSMDYRPNNLTVKLCFYHMNEDDTKKIEEGYSKVKMIPLDKNGNQNRFKAITEGQGMVEEGKLNKLIEATTESLETDPKRKLILFVNRKKTMNTLRQVFKPYGALVANSDVKGEERKNVFNKFQADSNECRVLITSTKLGGTGLNLGDVVGDRPRTSYILPSYNYNDDYQALFRAARTNTKSHSIAIFVYCGNISNDEKVLLNQLEKSKVHKAVVSKESDMRQKIKHEIWYEDEKDRKD